MLPLFSIDSVGFMPVIKNNTLSNVEDFFLTDMLTTHLCNDINAFNTSLHLSIYEATE